MHVTTGFVTNEYSLVHDGGDSYHALFPPLDCGITLSYYISVQTIDGDISYNPFSAPDSQWMGDGLVWI